MAARSPSTLVTVSRAGLTLAAAFGLARVFGGSAWFGAVLVAALVPPLLFALADRRRWHSATLLLLLTVIGVVFAVFVDDPSETAAGIPTSSAFSSLGHDLSNAPHVLRSAKVPVSPVGAALVLAVVATYIIAAATELVARRLDAPIGAIGPSIALFVAVAALGSGAWAAVTAVYAFVVVAYLVALQYVEATARRTWFQAGQNRRSQAVSGGLSLGALVVALAIAVGPAFPGARGGALIPYRSIGRGQDSSVLTATSPLISIGAKLNPKNPNREVFTVESANPYRWRVIALDTFAKGKDDWRADTNGDKLSKLPRQSDEDNAQIVHQVFRLNSVDTDWKYWVPAAYRPVKVDIAGAGVLTDSSTIYVDKGLLTDAKYTVDSEIAHPSTDQLEQVTFDDLRKVPNYERNTQPPDTFPGRVGQLAKTVTAGAKTPYDQAIALQNFFQSKSKYSSGEKTKFTYDLQPNLGSSTDALVNFLFRDRRGFCEQFAAAYGEMARSLGLPTRIAVGYESGELKSDGRYHVTERQAHAWPEVWLGQSIGWYTFEPTPGRFDDVTGNGDPAAQKNPGSSTITTPTTVNTATSVPGTTPTTRATTPPSRVQTNTPTSSSKHSGGPSGWSRALIAFLVVVMGLLAALVTLVVLAVRRTRRRRHETDARQRVLGAWTEALDRLAAAGVEPRPSATALEFALRQAPAQGAGAAGPPLMDLARLQTAAMYAREEPSPDDADVAWDRVDTIERALRDNVSWFERWRYRLRPRRRERESVNA